MDRITEVGALIFLLIFAVVGFVIRLIYGVVKGEDTGAFLPALETAAVTFLGGFFARTFISVLLSSANDSSGVSLAVGWGFFFPVGVIDTVIYLIVHHPILTKPDALLWIAASVGGLSGMFSGIYRVYDWDGLGVPAFLLDSTWGLSGTTDGCLLHLINLYWHGHAVESFDRRQNNHRYKEGFWLKPTYAFTQGAVMSNLKGDSSTKLWHHENTHVWQNRVFGPLFTLTYLGWMALMLIPSPFVALIAHADLGDTIMALCYYNNPWEVWAYKIGGSRKNFMLWSDPVVIVASILFFGATLALVGLVISNVW